MKRRRLSCPNPAQGELFLAGWPSFRSPFRLRVGDVIRAERGLGLVIRVTESAAVILTNQKRREFTTRFDRRVSFQPSPRLHHISPNSEIEILNRPTR